MEAAYIVVPSIDTAVPIGLVPGVGIAEGIRLAIKTGLGRESQLGSDFVERILVVRKAELVAEEDGFGRFAVGGDGERQVRIDEGLRLLHQRRQIAEHGWGGAAGVRRAGAEGVLWLYMQVLVKMMLVLV